MSLLHQQPGFNRPNKSEKEIDRHKYSAFGNCSSQVKEILRLSIHSYKTFNNILID